jgi:drug/metabolite transporter (DMT)-like permease
VLSGETPAPGDKPRDFRKGLMLVAVFLLLDGAGNVISRDAFMKGSTPLQVVVPRFAGAMLFFLVVTAIKPVKLLDGWRSLTPRERVLAVAASLCGTVGGLGCYLYAMSQVEVALLSGFALTLPLFATAIECALQRRWPGPRFLLAATLSLGGGWILCR